MNKEDIMDLMRQLDCVQITPMAKWVMARCPLAEWTHESGGDTNLSFGISIHDNDISIFHCYTCHKKGPVTKLVELMDQYSPESFLDLLEDLDATETMGPPARQWDNVKRGSQRKTLLGDPLDAQYLEIYDEAKGHWYLEDRNITDETCNRLQLKFDPEDTHGETRILFPVFDPDHNLYGYSGRAIYHNVAPPVRDYHGLKKALLLLGSHRASEAEFILLTEGLFDYARGQQFGYAGTCATLFSSLTNEQADVLIKINKPVYGFFDNDNAGREGSLHAAKVLSKHLPYMAVAWPKQKRWRLGSDEKCIPGDLDQLHSDEVERMIDRAVLYRL